MSRAFVKQDGSDTTPLPISPHPNPVTPAPGRSVRAGRMSSNGGARREGVSSR